MNRHDLDLLIDYNYWANHKILEQATKVSAEDLTAPQPKGFSAGSLRGTLVHTLGAEWAWRSRLQHGVSPAALLKEIEFPSLSSIVLRWGNEEQRMRAFTGGLSDERLNEEVHYTTTDGKPRAHTIGHALTHMVLHGMQHRAECAVTLTNLGYSPGNIDLLYYLIEKGIA